MSWKYNPVTQQQEWIDDDPYGVGAVGDELQSVIASQRAELEPEQPLPVTVADAIRSAQPSMGPELESVKNVTGTDFPYESIENLIGPQPTAANKPSGPSLGQMMKVALLSKVPLVGSALAYNSVKDIRNRNIEWRNLDAAMKADYEERRKALVTMQSELVKENAKTQLIANNTTRYAAHFLATSRMNPYEATRIANAMATAKDLPDLNNMKPYIATANGKQFPVHYDVAHNAYIGQGATPGSVRFYRIEELEGLEPLSAGASTQANRFQSKAGLLDGKRSYANYDSSTGRYFIPGTQIDVSDRFVPAESASGGGDMEAWLAEDMQIRMQEFTDKFQRQPTALEVAAMRKASMREYKLTGPVYSAGAAEQRADTAYSRRLTLNFMSSPTVVRFNKAAEGIAFALRFDPKTQNPFDHQALIYAFAKVMDPESVVREGEYKTVQKYAQSWKEKFGLDLQRIIDNKGILSAQAIGNLQKTMKEKFESTRQQLDGFRSEVGRMIDENEGTTGAVETLPDYTKGYGSLLQGGKTIFIRTSAGLTFEIYEQNLEEAKRRDPKLEVIKNASEK